MTESRSRAAGTREEAGVPRDPRGKRALIMKAARALFANGYERTSMGAVAERAGVSKATLYSYFPAKPELFVAIVEESSHRMRVQVEAGDGAQAGAVDAHLLQIGQEWVALLTVPDNVSLFRVVIAESPYFPELAKGVLEVARIPTRTSLSRWIAGRVAAGELSCENPCEAAEFFFNMLHGGMVLDALLGFSEHLTPARLDAHLRLCVRAFIATYRPAVR